MKLYHYSTWAGHAAAKEGWLRPSNKYQVWTGNSILTQWPKLVFLTQNEWWEPSVQTSTPEKYWEKCGSCPEVYEQLGIPCWKFEVSPDSIVPFAMMAVECGDKWRNMVLDASVLGSNPDQWAVTISRVKIERLYAWKNSKWI